MAALPLFRNIKMATVTTHKNTIHTIYILLDPPLYRRTLESKTDTVAFVFQL